MELSVTGKPLGLLILTWITSIFVAPGIWVELTAGVAPSVTTTGMSVVVGVAVLVEVTVEVAVGVLVRVVVGVFVGVLVAVEVEVPVGVEVEVIVGVMVGVFVELLVTVAVKVEVGVGVGVAKGNWTTNHPISVDSVPEPPPVPVSLARVIRRVVGLLRE
jgi:hypothetical protein